MTILITVVIAVILLIIAFQLDDVKKRLLSAEKDILDINCDMGEFDRNIRITGNHVKGLQNIISDGIIGECPLDDVVEQLEILALGNYEQIDLLMEYLNLEVVEEKLTIKKKKNGKQSTK